MFIFDILQCIQHVHSITTIHYIHPSPFAKVNVPGMVRYQVPYDVEFIKHARICVNKINEHLPTMYRHSELPALLKFATEMVVPAPF